MTTQPEEVQETAAPVPTESEEAPATASPEPSDEVPHARGPILLGVEDMGLQDGKGIEMSLSTDSTAGVPAAVAATPGSGEQGKESTADKDGDIVLEDKPKEKTKTEDTTEPQGDNVAPEQTGDLSQAPDADKQA